MNDEPAPPRLLQPELLAVAMEVARSIDEVLIAVHGMRAALKPGYPRFGEMVAGRWQQTPLQEGVARYGEGPVFSLWAMCRAIEGLRVAWTGYPSAPDPIAPVIGKPVPPVPPAAAEPETSAP